MLADTVSGVDTSSVGATLVMVVETGIVSPPDGKIIELSVGEDIGSCALSRLRKCARK